MGFGSSFKSVAKGAGIGGLVGGPMGAGIGGLLGGGGGLFGGLFRGGVNPADPEAKAIKKNLLTQSNIQTKSLKGLSKLVEGRKFESPEIIARRQQQKAENLARAGADDARRAAQEAVARRGLGGSSIGLRAELAPQRRLSEKLQTIRAQAPEAARQIRNEQYGQRIGGLQSVLGGATGAVGSQNVPLKFQDTRKKSLFSRLLPAIGTGVGAAYGSPQAGYGAGSAASGLFG